VALTGVKKGPVPWAVWAKTTYSRKEGDSFDENSRTEGITENQMPRGGGMSVFRNLSVVPKRQEPDILSSGQGRKFQLKKGGRNKRWRKGNEEKFCCQIVLGDRTRRIWGSTSKRKENKLCEGKNTED